MENSRETHMIVENSLDLKRKRSQSPDQKVFKFKLESLYPKSNSKPLIPMPKKIESPLTENSDIEDYSKFDNYIDEINGNKPCYIKKTLSTNENSKIEQNSLTTKKQAYLEKQEAKEFFSYTLTPSEPNLKKPENPIFQPLKTSEHPVNILSKSQKSIFQSFSEKYAPLALKDLKPNYFKCEKLHNWLQN